MNLQGRDLSIGMEGEDVKLLHSELRVLDYEIPDAELRRVFFGLGTQEIIMRFQEELGLESSGVVDEQTAQAINEQVEAHQPELYVVRGQVLNADGSPVVYTLVRAYGIDA